MFICFIAVLAGKVAVLSCVEGDGKGRSLIVPIYQDIPPIRAELLQPDVHDCAHPL